MMGLGQGNRAAPPSWIQLSLVMVNVFKKLGRGVLLTEPITSKMTHTMRALFVDNTDLYSWKDDIRKQAELWVHSQLDLQMWSCLLNVTGGKLKAKKCYWYTLNYKCTKGKWIYAKMVTKEMLITNLDESKSPIKQEEVNVSKKTLGVHDSLSGGNVGYIEFIKNKATTWVNSMTNGHLPHHMAWIAYQHQLWPGLRYTLGMMTNYIDAAENLLNKED
jgi:hypothetical protein